MNKLIKAIKERESQEWLIAGVIIICTLCAIFYVFSYKTTVKEVQAPIEKISFSSSAQHGDLKSYFTNQINKKIKEQDAIVRGVEETVTKALTAKEDEVAELKKANQELAEKIDALLAKLDSPNKNNEAMLGTKINNQNFDRAAFDPNVIPAHFNQVKLPPLSNNSSVTFGGSDELELVSVTLSNNKPKFKNINTYVPAGTYIKGVVTGGVDASTEVNGSSNQTRVVTIRLIDNGNIPGGFKSNLKDCTLLASAWGVASSERIAARGERLTCVASTGNVLEANIVAAIYGADGRQDIRGRMVYPEGKLLTRAFLAGSLSGIGNGVANSFSAQSISPLGATNIIPNEDVFKYGAAQGVGKGLDKLADYYIKRAEQLQPVVQLGSGSLVTVMVQKGFYLDGKEHQEELTQNPESPFEKNNVENKPQNTAQQILANIKETF